MLIINNIQMPEPSSLKITKHKIWSKNTERAADATMVGDLIGLKYEIEVQWKALTSGQAKIVDAAISSAFFSVTFIDPATGQQITKTFYAGDPSYQVYSYVFNNIVYSGGNVSLIEQ